MSKKNIIGLHAFTWLFAAFVNLRDFSLLSNPEKLTVFAVSTLFLGIAFYLFYFFAVPQYLEKKLYARFIVAALAILSVLPFFGYSALFLIKAGFSHDFSNFYGHYSFRMHLSGMSVLLVAGSFGTFFKIFLNWLNTINQKEALEKEKAVAELALLKSKVNPHFLFNTLNNIDALISEDPSRASQSLLKLSEIMRYMTYETASEFISLPKEINYITGILSLYSLRVSNPEAIRTDIPEPCPDLPIAPLLFVPFIENAYKFATFKGENAGFGISFTIEDQNVRFTCANHYDTRKKPAAPGYGGTGIAHVKRRLEHIYPGRHSLEITDRDGFFKVELTVDTHGN
jgi:hypothetical protein